MRSILLIVIVGILSLTSCEAEKDNTALTFDGNQISYVDKGTGKLSIVFIHGWCANKYYWENQLDALSGNYRVVALDLAGHGESSKRRKHWTPENFSRDVVAVVQELKLKNVVLVGHSIAEDILIRASRMMPEKTLAIVGVDNFKTVNTVMTDSLRSEVDRFFKLIKYDYKGTAKAFAYDQLLVPGMKPKVRGRILRDVVTADTSVSVPILRYLFEDYESQRAFLKDLIVPLYLINSSYRKTNTNQLKKYCSKGFYMAEIDSCGHYSMLERPKEFNSELEKVLKDIRAKR